MALSDEQNAMLRLLGQGEQSYADIAALMGLSEEEVRAKVVGALAQLQAEGKPAPDVPPPIAADQQPAAATPADAPPEPEPRPSAAPGPAAAAPPRSAATAPAPPSPSGRGPSGGRTITLPSGRSAWLLGGGVASVVVVIVVVILLISGGGDAGPSAAPTEGAKTTAGEAAGAEDGAGAKPATEAELKPVDGSGAKGFASFGRVKDKLALQVEATGLAPTEEGTNSYAIWLARSPRKMIPLASTGVKASGRAAGVIAAQFEVPVEILGYLAGGTFDKIAITKVDDKRFENAVKVATRRKRTPTYLGKEVLRGTITGPIVGIAVREEEAKKAEEANE